MFFFYILSFIFPYQQRWSLSKSLSHSIYPLYRAPRMHSIFKLVSSILLATVAIAQSYNYGGSYDDGFSGSVSSSGGGAVSGATSTPTSSAAVSKTATHTGCKETLAGGDVKVQVVKVSNNNGDLTFTPNNITAAVGSFVQFHFYPKVSDRSTNPQSIA